MSCHAFDLPCLVESSAPSAKKRRKITLVVLGIFPGSRGIRGLKYTKHTEGLINAKRRRTYSYFEEVLSIRPDLIMLYIEISQKQNIAA